MPKPLHILLHVPKCAGTTVEMHLARHLGDSGFWSPPKRSRRLPLELLGRKYDARLPGPADEIRAVSGHFIGRSVPGLFPGRPARISILLRDPAALMLSWYNYRMMRYRADGLRSYPFRLHVLSLPPDPIAHFLLERWFEMPWPQMAALPASRKIALLDEALSGFDFVGDVSDADRLIASVSRDLGIPETAERTNTGAAWEAQTGWQPLRREDLTPADAALLSSRTRLDNYLWRRWALGQDARIAAVEVAPFLASELVRPVHELRRRALRRA